MSEKVLYAGYFAGEFGWELMAWQARIRHVAKGYDSVLIGCQYGHDFLYSDFADEFVYFTGKIDRRNMWLVNQKETPLPREIMREKTTGYIIPNKEFCTGKRESKWVPYGAYNVDCKYDILIHDRRTTNFSTGYRNYPKDLWEDVLLHFDQYRIGCIGTKDGAGCFQGCDDLRGLPLSVLADVLASSRVIVGPSSGPMHFASLCGCPQIVFTDNRRQVIGQSNKERYENGWNPFGIKCSVLDGRTWQPESKAVVEAIKCYL